MGESSVAERPQTKPKTIPQRPITVAQNSQPDSTSPSQVEAIKKEQFTALASTVNIDSNINLLKPNEASHPEKTAPPEDQPPAHPNEDSNAHLETMIPEIDLMAQFDTRDLLKGIARKDWSSQLNKRGDEMINEAKSDQDTAVGWHFKEAAAIRELNNLVNLRNGYLKQQKEVPDKITQTINRFENKASNCTQELQKLKSSLKETMPPNPFAVFSEQILGRPVENPSRAILTVEEQVRALIGKGRDAGKDRVEFYNKLEASGVPTEYREGFKLAVEQVKATELSKEQMKLFMSGGKFFSFLLLIAGWLAVKESGAQQHQ